MFRKSCFGKLHVKYYLIERMSLLTLCPVTVGKRVPDVASLAVFSGLVLV